MNRPNDHERLLADVMAGADATGFREALFGETLCLARRRRRFRQVRRAVPVVAVFVGLALLMRQGLPPRITPREAMQKSNVVVLTQPQPAAALVLTRPLGIDHLVASFTNVQTVQTAQHNGLFREIDDDELLALARPEPAALVRLGPHTAELIVLNSMDQTAPPPN